MTFPVKSRLGTIAEFQTKEHCFACWQFSEVQKKYLKAEKKLIVIWPPDNRALNDMAKD